MNGADLSRAIADMPCRCTEDDACAAHTALEELVAVQPARVSDDDVARAFHESPAAAPTITSVADDKMDDLAESFVPTLDSLISSVIRDESLPDARNAAARRCASIAWHEGARRG